MKIEIIKTNLRQFLLNVILLVLYSGLALSCKDELNPGNPPNGSGNDNRAVYYTNNLHVVVSKTPGSNSYRPLGNDPMPYTSQPVTNAFSPANFAQIQYFSRTLNSVSDADLRGGNLETLRIFYIAYKNENNVTFDEYEKLHVFGVTRFRDLGPQTGGITYKFNGITYSGNNKTPSLSFVLAGNLDSSMKARNLSDDLRKKAITISTVHELGHGRGLFDLSAAPGCDPHSCHYDIDLNKMLYCSMNFLSDGTVNSMYQPFFCQQHMGYITDSLRGKIIEGLYMRRIN